MKLRYKMFFTAIAALLALLAIYSGTKHPSAVQKVMTLPLAFAVFCFVIIAFKKNNMKVSATLVAIIFGVAGFFNPQAFTFLMFPIVYFVILPILTFLFGKDCFNLSNEEKEEAGIKTTY